jgi:hypothetical protein
MNNNDDIMWRAGPSDSYVWDTKDSTWALDSWPVVQPPTMINVDGRVYSFTDAEVTTLLTEIKETEILAEEFPQIRSALNHLRAIVKLHKAE